MPGVTRETVVRFWAAVGAAAVGGAVGASARYAAMLVWPGLWTILAVNVVGCALIGALRATMHAERATHPLLGPFAGTGVLGGFTTFSTYVVDFGALVDAGARGTALAYLVATPVGSLLAVWVGTVLTRRLLRRAAR